MTRFFVEAGLLHSDYFALTGENATHAKVLRLKPGEQVVVCDGHGEECICTICDMSTGQVSLAVNKRQSAESEAAVKVSVYMAFSKGDKFEHVVQKATELGAMEIIAYPTARCVSKPDPQSIRKKVERWQKIARSAAEQSGRGCVPVVLTVDSYSAALLRAQSADKAILFYEDESATTLRMALEDGAYSSVSLLTGPEGGLELKEVQQAIDAGIRVCTLGKRILRCETAPLCALSAVMYHTGEF